MRDLPNLLIHQYFGVSVAIIWETIARDLRPVRAAIRRMKTLESERNNRRRALFESQDEIDRKRGELIAQLEAQLTQTVTSECLFSVPWRVV